MDNVVRFPSAKLDALTVIEASRNADLDEVIIVGRTPEGLLYLASSYESEAYVLFDLMQAQRVVLDD